MSLRISSDKRMAIHVAALRQDSLTYDEFTKRALEQERIAQQKSTTCVPTKQQPTSNQSRVPLTVSPAQSIGPKREIAVDKGKSARRPVISDDCRTKTEGKPKKSLRQRLVDVCNAWDELQETRNRDAVYDYLRPILAIVKRYRGRRRTRKLLRRAFKFAGLPFDKNADPFAVIIRCTCEQQLDCTPSTSDGAKDKDPSAKNM